MHDALQALAPGVRVWTRGVYPAELLESRNHDAPGDALSATIGDFDADGRLDAAMLTDHGLIAVLDRSAGPTATCITRCELVSPHRPEIHHLVLQPRATVSFPAVEGDAGDFTITLHGDAIHVIYAEQAAMMYYLVKGRWRAIQTAD